MLEMNKKNMIITILSIIVLVLFVQKIFSYKETNSVLSDFDNISKTPKFINFNASWCYWSKKLKPTWDRLKDEMIGKDIEILDVKCDLDSNKDLCERYQIDGYPSIKLLMGNKIISYEGDRSLEDMKKFINDFVDY